MSTATHAARARKIPTRDLRRAEETLGESLANANQSIGSNRPSEEWLDDLRRDFQAVRAEIVRRKA